MALNITASILASDIVCVHYSERAEQGDSGRSSLTTGSRLPSNSSRLRSSSTQSMYNRGTGPRISTWHDGDLPVHSKTFFHQQRLICSELGSPFMGRLMALLGEGLVPGTVVFDALLHWLDPISDYPTMRISGALHAVVLTGTDPNLPRCTHHTQQTKMSCGPRFHEQ